MTKLRLMVQPDIDLQPLFLYTNTATLHLAHAAQAYAALVGLKLAAALSSFPL